HLRVHGADTSGGSVGLFYLAEDLRLAHHHGVEAGGDAKEVANDILPAEFVKVLAQSGGIDLKTVGDEMVQLWCRRRRQIRNQQLHAIAGGEDKSLFDAVKLRQ